jgi:acyl-coenzyme A thioesterase PaaI-like protein
MCVACSPWHPHGYQLWFEEQPDGSMVGQIHCSTDLEGYPGLLQGGFISLVFDSAMVHCMFARGFRALTAELSVKFMRPVKTGGTATVAARIVSDMHPLYLIEAELTQDRLIRAKATAKFMVQEE